MINQKFFNKRFLLIATPIIIIIMVILFVNFSESKKISNDYLYNTAGKTLQEKIDIFLIKDKHQKTSKEFYEYNSEKYLIAEFRDRLYEKGESYDGSSLNLSIENQYIDNDGLLHILAKEVTYLTSSVNNIKTGYEAKHEFIYNKPESTWILVEDRQLEPSGLLPLYQANNFIYIQ